MGYSKRFSADTVRRACCVVSLLTRNASGIDAASIRRLCGFSPKQTETALITLLSCGAVARVSVVPKIAKRGARARFLYFPAFGGEFSSGERWGGAESSDADGAFDDCAIDAEKEDDFYSGGGTGGGAPDETELAPFDPPESVDGEFAVAFEGELLPGYDGGIIAENRGIIDGKDREIIEPSSSFININTQGNRINKRARGLRASKKREYQNRRAASPSGAKMNALVASVTLDDADATEFRRKIALIAWDSQTHSDLYDRLVAAYKLGFVTVCEAVNAARKAVDEAKRLGVSNWYRFARFVKGLWDKQKIEWVPTRFILEPSPFGLRNLVSLRLNDSLEDDLPEVREIVRPDGTRVNAVVL